MYQNTTVLGIRCFRWLYTLNSMAIVLSYSGDASCSASCANPTVTTSSDRIARMRLKLHEAQSGARLDRHGWTRGRRCLNRCDGGEICSIMAAKSRNNHEMAEREGKVRIASLSKPRLAISPNSLSCSYCSAYFPLFSTADRNKDSPT